MGTLVTLALPDRLPQQILWQRPLVVDWVWQPGYSFSLQVAAVLFTALVGGPRAGFIAQVAYVAIGLWFYPVFFEGGGLDYLTHPSMGYLIGFIPGAWLTGTLAYRQRSNINWLVASGLLGLSVIHLCGIAGLIAHWGWQAWTMVWLYSAQPLLGQALSLLLAALLGLGVRRLFFT